MGVYTPPVVIVNDSISYGPNPMGSVLVLKFDPASVTGVSVELFDLNGSRVVFETGVPIDVAGLQPGVDVIRIVANGGNLKVVGEVMKR